VSGTIQNTGSQTATNVRAIATFYNSSNTVIAAGYSEPISSLSPLGSGAFKVGAFDLNQTLATPDRMVSSYTLIIQAAGPLLTGTPPEPSSYSSSFSTNSSTPSNPSNNSTDSGSNNNPSNPASSGLNYVAIVIVIIIIIGGLLAYSRIRSGKGSNKKQAKSQKTAKRQQSSKRD
jgi:ATP-dependent Zn protease